MEERAKRILIAEPLEDLAEMMTMALEDGGYEVASFAEDPALPSMQSDFLAQIADFSPDLIMVDLRPDDQGTNDSFLDRLRLDPSSARIPILTIATDGDVVDRSIASYNVRETLTTPFHLDEMMEKVDRAMNEPIIAPAPQSIPCPEDDVFCQGQLVLAEQSREALFRWVQRLRAEPDFAGRSDLRLASYIDHVPLLVEAVTAAVSFRSAEELFRRSPEVLVRAVRHAETRRSQGIPLEGVTREYTLLRDELMELFIRHLPKDVSPDNILALARVVNTTLDRIIEITIPAYANGKRKVN